MDEPIDRALARAAEGPEDGVDLDEVAATARRRRRRQRVVASAGVLLGLLAIPAVTMLGWSEPDGDAAVLLAPGERDADPPPPEGAAGADTPERRAEVELEVRRREVPRCGAVEFRLRNTGEVDLSASRRGVDMQRWDGEGWYEVPAMPAGYGWLGPSVGAAAGATDRAWREHRIDRLGHIQPGWYRLSTTVSDEPGGDLELQPATVFEVVADDRETGGDCGPSAEELAGLDAADEAVADITGDGQPDRIALYAHDRGTSVLAETADGQRATAWVDYDGERELKRLGSRALPGGQAGADLAGDGREEILLRREDGRTDYLTAVAWHRDELTTIYRSNNHLGSWTLRTGVDATTEERFWLECTDEGVRSHAAGPLNDEDAPFALHTTTYQLRDGLAQPVESTEEQLNELPDLEGPVIDCDR